MKTKIAFWGLFIFVLLGGCLVGPTGPDGESYIKYQLSGVTITGSNDSNLSASQLPPNDMYYRIKPGSYEIAYSTGSMNKTFSYTVGPNNPGTTSEFTIAEGGRQGDSNFYSLTIEGENLPDFIKTN